MSWPFLALALLCAGFVQGLTGFGFGLVSMSLMPLVIGVKQAAAISTVFSTLATVTTFVRHYRDYNWRRGLTFLASVCLGVPVGVYFLDRGSESMLLRVMGIIMILFAAPEFLDGPGAGAYLHSSAWPGSITSFCIRENDSYMNMLSELNA